MSLYSEKNDYIGEKKTEYVKIKMEKLTLINLFKKSLNILRDLEGITGGKALRNMTYLFVLKLLEPKLEELKLDTYDIDFSHIIGDEEEYKNGLFKNLRFTNLSKVEEIRLPDILKNMWEDILSKHPTTSKIFLPGSGFDIKNQNTFKKLIDAFNSFELLNTTEYDVLGNAYEEVVKDMSTGKALGQFFTPPSVKNLMIKLIDPKIREDGSIETCGDPTMGTGGFLITYIKYIIEKSKKENVKLDWEFVKNGLYGKEKEPETYQLAVSNMLISSGHMFENLEIGDSIRDPITRKFDNVLANPPFGIKGFEYEDFAYGIKNEYVPIKSNKAVSLFIQAIIYMLKINGKCAVVLPYGSELFSKTDASLVAVREYLMKTCDLKEIILLPQDIFTYASIKTCVFYFIKKVEGSDALEIVDKKLSTRSQKSTRSYKFSELCQTKTVKFYDYDLQKDDCKNLIIEVSIEKIIEKSYSLYYPQYMNVKQEKYQEGIELKTLGEICSFLPKSKKNASNGKKEGKYPFYTSSQITKYSDEYDYDEECLIIGSGGNANIKYNNRFSCSTDNFILKLNTVLTKYVYYYLSINITILQKGFVGIGIQHISKDYLKNIKIPIPSLERQKEIVEYCEYNETLILQLKKEIEIKKSKTSMFMDSVLKSSKEEEDTVTPTREKSVMRQPPPEEKHVNVLEEEKSGSRSRERLELLNITKLKNIARDLKIPRYSTFKSVDKPILIELILKI